VFYFLVAADCLCDIPQALRARINDQAAPSGRAAFDRASAGLAKRKARSWSTSGAFRTSMPRTRHDPVFSCKGFNAAAPTGSWQIDLWRKKRGPRDARQGFGAGLCRGRTQGLAANFSTAAGPINAEVGRSYGPKAKNLCRGPLSPASINAYVADVQAGRRRLGNRISGSPAPCRTSGRPEDVVRVRSHGLTAQTSLPKVKRSLVACRWPASNADRFSRENSRPAPGPRKFPKGSIHVRSPKGVLAGLRPRQQGRVDVGQGRRTQKRCWSHDPDKFLTEADQPMRDTIGSKTTGWVAPSRHRHRPCHPRQRSASRATRRGRRCAISSGSQRAGPLSVIGRGRTGAAGHIFDRPQRHGSRRSGLTIFNVRSGGPLRL